MYIACWLTGCLAYMHHCQFIRRLQYDTCMACIFQYTLLVFCWLLLQVEYCLSCRDSTTHLILLQDIRQQPYRLLVLLVIYSPLIVNPLCTHWCCMNHLVTVTGYSLKSHYYFCGSLLLCFFIGTRLFFLQRIV